MPVITTAVVPLALGGLLFLLMGDEKPAPPGAKPPGPADFQPPALDALTEVRMISGVAVRYFRPKVAEALITMLAGYYLRPSSIKFTGEPGQQIAVYDLVAVGAVVPQQGLVTARQQVIEIAQKGLAVLGTLNLPMPQDAAARSIAFTTAGARLVLAAAAAQTPFAVLLDPYQSGPGPEAPPGTPPYTTPPVITPPGMPPGPPPVIWDEGMPVSVRKSVQALLDDPKASPDALEQAASDMEDKYPIAAGKLRARASEIRELGRLRDIKKGGTAHQIRSGDLPYLIAEHYTGDRNRWKEIAQVPLNKGMQNTPKGPVPWHGTVYLPLSWECWNKPLPPVAKGSPKVKLPEDLDDIPPDLLAEADIVITKPLVVTARPKRSRTRKA